MFCSRAKKCVFLGYPVNVKGYKLFDLETHTCFVSLDVIFHEDDFPFETSSTPSCHDTFSFTHKDPINSEHIVPPLPASDISLPLFADPIPSIDTTSPPTLISFLLRGHLVLAAFLLIWKIIIVNRSL